LGQKVAFAVDTYDTVFEKYWYAAASILIIIGLSYLPPSIHTTNKPYLARYMIHTLKSQALTVYRGDNADEALSFLEFSR
jgi:hypothetical protein